MPLLAIWLKVATKYHWRSQYPPQRPRPWRRTLSITHQCATTGTDTPRGPQLKDVEDCGL